EKPFHCSVCGRSFTQKHTLLAHQRIHTGEKPFVCSICSKALSTKHSLQEHMNLHEGEKPYKCNICEKPFSDPSARRRHIASHSGKKPFTCSFCGLSFTRLDNLKTHTKSHNKERPVAAEASSAAAQETTRNVLHLQQYQPALSSEQEIQLVVAQGVNNLNFVPSQDQEISLIAADGGTAQSAHSRLTLLTQPSGQIQNLALVSQGDTAAQTPQIHSISMLQSHQSEQMHVITLSKEAMDHLQANHGPPHPLQIARPIQVTQQPLQHLAVAQESSQGLVSGQQHSQAIHISSQVSQPISISQTSEQISSHHIQGQTFQIQAGTVSYLYTTGLPQDS
ncbi:hypothetical protein XENOCAPTIV_014286, partial [Xenoophorus captivus]